MKVNLYSRFTALALALLVSVAMFSGIGQVADAKHAQARFEIAAAATGSRA